jgi:hypothetical protein
MICYRDKTWCNFRDCSQFGWACERSLTAQVHRDAREWWGDSEGDPPIAIYSTRPLCFSRQNDGDN